MIEPDFEIPKSLQSKIARRNVFLDWALNEQETFETSRKRVMKGILGCLPASKFERNMRKIRAERKADEEYASQSAGTDRALITAAERLLNALIAPKRVEKRRKKSGREIRSELWDTPLGRKVGA